MTPVQNLIDAAEEAAGLIGDHLKAQADTLPEEQLAPWSLMFSQLQTATNDLRECMRAEGPELLAVGGPMDGQRLTFHGLAVLDIPAGLGGQHRYERRRLCSKLGVDMTVAVYMGLQLP